MASSVRALRLRNGFSQRELARRIGTPRTWVSKVENHKATPTLRSLVRLACALNCSVCDLVVGHEQARQRELSELTADPFIAELLPFVGTLGEARMRGILAWVHEMVARRKRAAA